MTIISNEQAKDAYEVADNNIYQAASLLGVHHTTLRKRLQKMDIIKRGKPRKKRPILKVNDLPNGRTLNRILTMLHDVDTAVNKTPKTAIRFLEKILQINGYDANKAANWLNVSYATLIKYANLYGVKYKNSKQTSVNKGTIVRYEREIKQLKLELARQKRRQ